MGTNGLHPILITNKSFGSASGTTVFLTEGVFESLSNKKARDGTPLISLLQSGRAVQGLKHLIETVTASNPSAKLVLTDASTRRVKDEYWINLEDYRNKSQARFFSLYRETGLNSARSYLHRHFPDEFELSTDELNHSDIQKVNRELPRVLSELSKLTRNKIVVIREATATVAKLERRNKALREALEDLQRQSSVAFYEQKLEEFRDRLLRDYHETSGKNSWQNWIYSNSWLFGTQYLEPIDRQRISFDSIPDFLFPTLDGFLDILEIKKPGCDVVRQDPAHPGSYAWCPDTNRAIGQVTNYIQKIELNQLALKEHINLHYGERMGLTIQPLKPRAFVLAGQSEGWAGSRKNALRNLNFSLHGIEVLTYTDLIRRAESLIRMLQSRAD